MLYCASDKLKKVLKANRWPTVPALNKRGHVNDQPLTTVTADIEAYIISSLQRFWMLMNVS